MLRISDLNQPCPICSSSDWCMVSDDGKYVACKRVAKNSITDLGKLGYLHRMPESLNIQKIQKKERPNVSQNEWLQYQQSFTNQLSSIPDLGLQRETLVNYGIGWNGKGWTFPVYGRDTQICGMQVRFPDNKRMCITGSRAGVFLPRRCHPGPTWAISEGLSDAATVYELGINCIGRWNWETPDDIIYDLVGTHIHPILLIIIADNDPVDPDLGFARGLKGANDLRDMLWDKVRSVVLTMPSGIKDIRQFRQRGLTPQKFNQAIQRLIIKEWCK